MTKLIPFELSNLTMAPENARYGADPGDLSHLKASIAAFGELIEPLKAYTDGGVGHVWDGGRRLQALQALHAEGVLPDHLVHSVPVIVTSKEDAALRSVATFVRDRMHPAVEFLAYNRLFDQGLNADQIAAACGVDSAGVAKLLRFRVLASEILQAFKDGGMTLDAALAFTLTDDHESQLCVFKSFNGKAPDPYYVRERLKKGALNAHDRTARIVGREAYAAAGGRFLVDLFSRNEADEVWADSGLAHRLLDEKIEALKAELIAEGWGSVVVSQQSYGWANGYRSMTPSGKAAKGKKAAYSADQLARGVAFIVVDYGKLDVQRGYEKEKPAPAKTKVQDAARFGYGHAGHAKMTIAATEATKAALIANPTAAYDALLSHVAWEAFRAPTSQYTATTASALKLERHPRLHDVHVAGSDTIAEARDGWAARLPMDRVTFCDYIAGLSADEKAQLLAVSYALTLHAQEARADAQQPDRWAHLGWMARHAGVKIGEAWTPDEAFLKGASREALLLAVKELNNGGKIVHAKGWANAKKGELAAFVARRAAETGWTPKLLATLTDVESFTDAEVEELQDVADED